MKRAHVQIDICHPVCPRHTLIEHELEMGRSTGLTETVNQTAYSGETGHRIRNKPAGSERSDAGG